MNKLDESGDQDPRIIRGAKILRTLALDELPQFWNVLRGDMTLVGPRPCIPYEAAEFLMWHRQRFDLVPGLTGLWQVSGKNKLSFKEMIRLDNSYGRRMSLLLDLKILALTPPALFVIALEALMRKLGRGEPECEDCPEAEHEHHGASKEASA